MVDYTWRCGKWNWGNLVIAIEKIDYHQTYVFRSGFYFYEKPGFFDGSTFANADSP